MDWPPPAIVANLGQTIFNHNHSTKVTRDESNEDAFTVDKSLHADEPKCGTNRLADRSFRPTTYGSGLTPFGPANQLNMALNIHFTTGHEKDLDMIAAAGFKYVRMDFGWKSIERTKGLYDFTAFEELIANLKQRHMRAIAILDYSNPLYEQAVEYTADGIWKHGITSPQHPESVAAFVKWAVALTTHFKDDNIVWELWNEPDISWIPARNVQQYTTLATATAKAIKKAVPAAILIGPTTSEVALGYIEKVMASGILGYLDAVSVHPYRRPFRSPETVIRDYKDLRALIAKYAPADKKNIPIISSEWGYYATPKGVAADVQAAYLVRMQLINVMEGVPLSTWYDWKNDGKDPAEKEHNFGIVSFDLSFKPAYLTAKTISGQLNGYTYLGRVIVASDSDYVLLFCNHEGSYKLAAWTADRDHTIALNRNIEIAPAAVAVAGNGVALQLNKSSDKWELILGGLPQYVALTGLRDPEARHNAAKANR